MKWKQIIKNPWVKGICIALISTVAGGILLHLIIPQPSGKINTEGIQVEGDVINSTLTNTINPKPKNILTYEAVSINKKLKENLYQSEFKLRITTPPGGWFSSEISIADEAGNCIEAPYQKGDVDQVILGGNTIHRIRLLCTTSVAIQDNGDFFRVQ